MPKQASTKTANINVRLYPELKAQAESVFAYHGLSLPEAITVFLSHSCHAGGFPFELHGGRWNDPISLAALEECKQMEANPSAYKSYRDIDELFADCLEGDDDDD
ncbi:MAG: type II toxin-antitoxin system RelB/DinJ family antitoxin [Defluviitaleaceae bacterium]|nr:type II toxin-antitoxin system RelB/DinJ family antitoxin [Defluviitaleaceae bacterium]